VPPRFVEKAEADRAGLRNEAALPSPLPHNLRPRDLLRMVEELYELLHDINTRLVDRGYDRLEELLEPAGFSGLISSAVVDGLAKFSRALVKNAHHNGFPDLLPKGVYPGDAVQRGGQGGLEVKASRSESGWQAHGPRAGWFCVVQFEIDSDTAKALQDREPTRVLSMLVAELGVDDWSWQPAAPGRIRSGTASVTPTGAAKLREGAVWVDPNYQAAHEERLVAARRRLFGAQAVDLVLGELARASEPLKPADVAERLGPTAGLDPALIHSPVQRALKVLVSDGRVHRPARGLYETV